MTQPSSGGPVVLGDRYELGGVLGRGGMAEVHEGRDLRLGRRVAIKVLRADLARDPSFQARFRREGQSAASLNHPAIVAVYDTGEDLVDGTAVPYIVMEHVDGSTLRDLLHSGRRLLPERAMEIMVGVLDALDYSHRHGIVHRDIKPANVMLTRAGDVKVMDFGIARTVAEATAAMTQTSAVIGTAQYLSPEQARGETVDARSDLYSAGCLLYELLTGRPPFVGDSPVSVAYQHVREEPLAPSTVDPDVPAAADAVTLKALAKDREARYQTAAEMRADLERALAGRPVEAPAAAASTQRMAPVAVPIGTATALPASSGQERSGGRRAGVYALLALAVIAVFVGAAFAGRALFTRDAAVRVVVPSVRDKTQAQAEQILRGAGFTVNVSPANDSAAKGLVIDQEPPAGQRVSKGSAVTITVSTGPEMTTVPPLQGLSQDQAITALQDKQLTNGGITQQDSDQKEGQVLSSDPAQGEQVKTGTPVKLVVSSGKNKVPDVKGQSLAAATSALQDATFVVGTPIEEVTDAAPPGTVLRTDPPAGESLRQGATVTPTIAKAPDQPSPQPSPTDTASQPPASTPPTSPSTVPTTPAG